MKTRSVTSSASFEFVLCHFLLHSERSGKRQVGLGYQQRKILLYKTGGIEIHIGKVLFPPLKFMFWNQAPNYKC